MNPAQYLTPNMLIKNDRSEMSSELHSAYSGPPEPETLEAITVSPLGEYL